MVKKKKMRRAVLPVKEIEQTIHLTRCQRVLLAADLVKIYGGKSESGGRVVPPIIAARWQTSTALGTEAA